MKTESLKKIIKGKFGTYTNFTNLAKMERYEFQKNFLSKEDVGEKLYARIERLCEQMEPGNSKNVIAEKTLPKLRKLIDGKGGVVLFCRDNKGFPERTVFGILQGKWLSGGVAKRLLKYFDL